MKNNIKKFTAMLLSLAIGLSLVNTGTIVYAQETTNELPDTTQFATVDELKSFNTDKSDGENSAKVYFGNNNQQWWIAGSQQDKGLTLFAATSLLKEIRFAHPHDQIKTYSDSWKCDYTTIGGSNPTEVYPNHYGASDIRNSTLKGLETNTYYFSNSEQALMNDTTIYTDDTRNYTDDTKTDNLIYSTTDKLYLAYGCNGEVYITVGKNTPEDLNGGLRIDKSYWPNPSDLWLWLRAPEKDAWTHALFARNDIEDKGVLNMVVDDPNAVVPAFELDISTVCFGSTVPVASDGKLNVNDAFTLRYNTKTLGSAVVSYDKGKVKLAGVPSGTYLVVQNSKEAIAKKNYK